MQWLKGSRTYLIAAALALATGLYAAGIIDDKAYGLAIGILAPGGLATLRAAVK